MYHIALYENGVFCTQIGGDVRTVAEASGQIERTMKGLEGEELGDIVGFRFDRSGTVCALIVTDDFGMPVKQIK